MIKCNNNEEEEEEEEDGDDDDDDDRIMTSWLTSITWEAQPTPWTKALLNTWFDADSLFCLDSPADDTVCSLPCWGCDLDTDGGLSDILCCAWVGVLGFGHEGLLERCAVWRVLATVPSYESKDVLTGAIVLGDVTAAGLKESKHHFTKKSTACIICQTSGFKYTLPGPPRS